MHADLENSSIFVDLNPQQLAVIEGFCSEVQKSDGDFLIQEDEQDNLDLYVLCSGVVEIVSNASEATSTEIVISRENKDIFGEMRWLNGHKRTASVRCRGNVEAIRIDGHRLMHFVEEDTAAGFHIMRRIALLLSRRMEDTDRLLKQILWNVPV